MMKIKIGNNNKISKSFIGENKGLLPKNATKNWFERHPIIVSILITFTFGFIFLFSFWDKVINYIENLFN